ncbi:MAG: Porphobilinogen deaminase [Ignavibacteriae bacterium]|nr:MAG: Porphobilinogen deaminase [Ignavibacteriota bacterium]
MKEKIKIGSRGSALALWQTNWVIAELKKILPELKVEIEIIKTQGDKILDAPLSKIGDKGLFTKELETALLSKKIDAAVHSLKDVPTKIPDGLTITAITKREDVRDVFISPIGKSYDFNQLPGNAKIATGSLRRKSQLLNWRKDLQIIDIRGNLNTRLSKLDSSDWHGMILAKAGVIRLGLKDRISYTMPLEILLPAVGQGALGIEIRQEDEFAKQVFEKLNHYETAVACISERALLRRLEGGCQIPVAAFGKVENTTLLLKALIGSLDGKTIIRDEISGDLSQAEELGILLAEKLLSQGGMEILKDIDRTNPI